MVPLNADSYWTASLRYAAAEAKQNNTSSHAKQMYCKYISCINRSSDDIAPRQYYKRKKESLRQSTRKKAKNTFENIPQINFLTLYALLIERDLGRLLVHVDVLEEGSVHVVGLLLDNGAELEQLVGDLLVGTLENVDKTMARLATPCSLEWGLQLQLTIQSEACPGR